MAADAELISDDAELISGSSYNPLTIKMGGYRSRRRAQFTHQAGTTKLNDIIGTRLIALRRRTPWAGILLPLQKFATHHLDRVAAMR
jgi:hypothetical protein